MHEAIFNSLWNFHTQHTCLPVLQPMPQSGLGLSLPDALGVVAVVLPDRNPLLSLVTVLGAAIATGNAIILVPSQKCPLPALTFIQVGTEEFD